MARWLIAAEACPLYIYEHSPDRVVGLLAHAKQAYATCFAFVDWLTEPSHLYRALTGRKRHRTANNFFFLLVCVREL